MRIAIVILAAGKGTRLKSKRAKVLHEIGGKPLLEHVIQAAAQIVPPQDIFVVVGHQAETVRAAMQPAGVHFVDQEEQRGTGHAIQMAERSTRDYEHLIVLSGDVPLLRSQTIAQLRDFHLEHGAAMTILTSEPADPTGYGRVVRRRAGSPEVAAIVEQKDLKPTQRSIPEINTGIYAFQRRPLFEHIGQLKADNAQKELYLTDMAALLANAGERVVAVEAPIATEVLGANTIAEMMDLDREMRLGKARRLMAEGVTIFRPETVTIGADVEVGPDTVLEPFVQLLGRTRIGSECRIRSYTVIENATVGDKVLLRHGCIVADSEIQDGAQIGPYAHVRPGCYLGKDSHVGNFVEAKKVRLGAGSKANHLSYLGDAEIGAGVNIGAGTITCNYDGAHKHRTLIGDGVFIGSDSTLVAPLAIGKGAYVAAASCVTEDVPEDALAVGRSRQVNKAGWARNRRAQAEARKRRQ